MNPLNPKKLLLTKWATVKQLAKQKHFLVSRLLQPDDPTAPIERVEIKVMFSKTAHDESCRTTACGGRVGFDGTGFRGVVLFNSIHSHQTNPRNSTSCICSNV